MKDFSEIQNSPEEVNTLELESQKKKPDLEIVHFAEVTQEVNTLPLEKINFKITISRTHQNPFPSALLPCFSASSCYQRLAVNPRPAVTVVDTFQMERSFCFYTP